MKYAKIGCCFGFLTETSPCCVCGQQVHHICSNDLCSTADLSKRFCSSDCVDAYFASEGDSQELTPSSRFVISTSSQATIINLAQDEPNENVTVSCNIPVSVAHYSPENSTNSVWTVIHKLAEPVSYRRKTFTHICLLCAENKPWQQCLCKTANASNAKSHIVRHHGDHAIATKEVQHRSQRAQRFMVDGCSKRSAPISETNQVEKEDKKTAERHKSWWQPKPNSDYICGHIARWLTRDGLPYNMITTTAFRELVAALTGDPDITNMASDTYHRILDNHYAKYLTDTSELLHKEHELLHGSPIMNMMHDLWTNKAKHCIAGVSCSFIDHTWKPRHFALLAVTKNDGHESAQVAALISRQLMTLYELNMEKMMRFTVSDTAPAARKISKEFDTTLQSDCAMYSLYLCIGYGIGMKESVRTQYTTDSVTKLTIKKKIVVTKGEAFPEGGALIRKLRALNNYFASSNSPQRVQRLVEIQRFHKLPQLAALLDIDVRVASASKLIQRSIINYPAFRAYFQNEDANKNEKNVFNCKTKTDWDLTIELKAMVHRVASLALVESQSAALLSSTMYVFPASRFRAHEFIQVLSILP